MSAYRPQTGARCSCKRGQQRDNCPSCEGTGMVIDFAAIRARTCERMGHAPHVANGRTACLRCGRDVEG